MLLAPSCVLELLSALGSVQLRSNEAGALTGISEQILRPCFLSMAEIWLLLVIVLWNKRFSKGRLSASTVGAGDIEPA